ncbi:MAG: TIGR02757 family protein [Nitrospirota bacterium]
MRRKARLGETLEQLYRTYDFAGRLRHDPIQVPRRYRRAEDAEVAGFIAAALAYGRVGLFLPVIEGILCPLGDRPARSLREMDVPAAARRFEGLAYRFQKERDILAFLHVLSVLLRRYITLKAAFLRHWSPGPQDTGAALMGFMAEAAAVDTSPVYGSPIRPGGLAYLFPSPRTGSACKRPNLFLRWMVRDRDTDLGLWTEIPKSRLVIPLDTHIGRVARCLGLTRRRGNDWPAAVEITAALRALDPEDPLKYDFALCHRGIAGLCRGRDEPACRACALKRAARDDAPRGAVG